LAPQCNEQEEEEALRLFCSLDPRKRLKILLINKTVLKLYFFSSMETNWQQFGTVVVFFFKGI
jgi:hypothetical protein